MRWRIECGGDCGGRLCGGRRGRSTADDIASKLRRSTPIRDELTTCLVEKERI
jgi:hypothetical protein